MLTRSIKIEKNYDGKTVKDVLRYEFLMSSSHIREIKLCENGIVLNGKRVYTNVHVKEGDILEALISDKESSSNDSKNTIPLDILFEDEYVLIINKPFGISVFGAKENEYSLADAVRSYLGRGSVFHPVNRLDKGTSGVMAVAKTGYMHALLQNLLHTESFKREYLALCENEFKEKTGIINAPIMKVNEASVKREINPKGKEAITEYEVLEYNKRYSLVKVLPKTGRTHQIRLHMAHIGHPLAGDFLYGKEDLDLITRPALHSHSISFIHPITKKDLHILSHLPEDMEKLIHP